MANNQLIASDNFASGSLAAGWTAVTGFSASKVVAGTPNVAEPNVAGTNTRQIWTGATFPNDQISEITINALTQEAGASVSFASMIVRCSSSAFSGYECVISGTAGTWNFTIYRFDAGAATTLKTGSLTGVAAGDIFTFAAFGTTLILYQNFSIVWVAIDGTYTSGSTGFGQTSTVNITHTQVSSWRGYSRQQQDGVWTKKEVVFPALAADLANSGAGVWGLTQILHEGNAQILSGTVYKALYGAGPTVNNGSAFIGYAESTDGINWTRYASNPVLAGYTSPTLVKSGSTYYLYAQPSGGAGPSAANVAVFTSSDMINWTLQNNNILTLGGVGAWDHSIIYTPFVFVNKGGTWYGFYAGGSNRGTYQQSVGVITSTDLINWTKYGGNPVLTNAAGASVQIGTTITLVNGVYYAWGAQCQLGQGGALSALDPSATVIYSSTDLINWTFVGHSVQQMSLDQGVNETNGQGNMTLFLQVGNQTYGYSGDSTDDSGAEPWTQVYQISRSVAPTTLANILAFPQTGTVQVASDNFSYGAGNLSANWTAQATTSPLKVVGTNPYYAEPTVVNVQNTGLYTGALFSGQQYSEVTLQTLTGTVGNNAYILPMVLGQIGAFSSYQLLLTAPINASAFNVSSSIVIYLRVAGAATQLGPSKNLTLQQGDVIRLTATLGSDGFVYLSAYQNGFLMLQVVDPASTFTSGYPGVNMFSQTLANTQISLWAGGNANVLPNYPGSSSWMQWGRDLGNKRGLRG